MLCCSVLRARKAWKGFSFIIILRLWRIFRVVTSKPRAKITSCRFLLPVLITETLGTVTTNSGYYEKRIFLSTFFELPFYSVSKFQTFSWIFAKHALGMLKGYRLLVVLFSVKIPRVIPASSQSNEGVVSGKSMLHRWRQSVCGALPR